MTKIQEISLDDLWESAPKSDRPFHPELLINLPNLARRYLENAIAPGTPLASAVRLWMHGEIKLDDRHCYNGLCDYGNDSGDREIYQPLADELQFQQQQIQPLLKSQD